MRFLVRKEYEQMTYTVARTPRVCLSSITFCFSLSANETRLLYYSHSGIDYIDCGHSIMAQWMGANTKRRHGRSNHHDLLLAHMKYLLLVFQLVWLINKKKKTGVMGCAKHRNNPFWILQSDRYWRRCEEESTTYSIQQFTQVCFSMKYIILLATVRFT